MNNQGKLLTILCIAAVLLFCGCVGNNGTQTNVTKTNATHNATTAPQSTVRYVELRILDGTKVGGKYVSESASFTTIVPMYVIDKYGTMIRGSGVETGITTSQIATMITIEDPSSWIDATLQEQARQEALKYKDKRAITSSFGSMSPDSVTSMPESIIQSTKVYVGGGYIETVIETMNSPIIDKQSVLNAALKMETGVDEIGTYDATLANGENITVHQREPSGGGMLDKFDICAFIPDNSTLVKITSRPTNPMSMKEFLKTLRIGEMSHII